VDTARTPTEEFVKGSADLEVYSIRTNYHLLHRGCGVKEKIINYMSEGGGVKPAKAYLEISLNISVTGTQQQQQQQQPSTLVGTGYL